MQQPRTICPTYHKEEMRLKLQMATDTKHHMYRVPYVSYVLYVINWTLGTLDARTLGPLDPWTLGPVDPLDPKSLDPWTLEPRL